MIICKMGIKEEFSIQFNKLYLHTRYARTLQIGHLNPGSLYESRFRGDFRGEVCLIFLTSGIDLPVFSRWAKSKRSFRSNVLATVSFVFACICTRNGGMERRA